MLERWIAPARRREVPYVVLRTKPVERCTVIMLVGITNEEGREDAIPAQRSRAFPDGPSAATAPMAKKKAPR